MNERAKEIGARLAFEIPLTPWPVLIWLVSIGDRFHPPHGGEPLSYVRGLAELSFIATTVVGFLLVLVCRRGQSGVGWLFFAVINGYILWNYIEAHALIYS